MTNSAPSPRSYIAQHEAELKRRHYIMRATTDSHWYNFYLSKVELYRKRTNDKFCLVVTGSDEYDDAYVMPYESVRELYSAEYLLENGRWIGTIRDNRISVTNAPLPTRSRSIGEFYNAFHLLQQPGVQSQTPQEAIRQTSEVLSRVDILEYAKDFDSRYRIASADTRIIVSEQLGRPNAITDVLKDLHKHTCQICGEKGFRQRNGALYIEAHHFRELHEYYPDSSCVDNLVVVCPTCHKKLHFARLDIRPVNRERFTLNVNGIAGSLSRNIILGDRSR